MASVAKSTTGVALGSPESKKSNDNKRLCLTILVCLIVGAAASFALYYGYKNDHLDADKWDLFKSSVEKACGYAWGTAALVTIAYCMARNGSKDDVQFTTGDGVSIFGHATLAPILPLIYTVKGLLWLKDKALSTPKA